MKPSSSSKAIASPGRALVEKFPPPLMRFLRSNVGSKSTRGKSKAKAKGKAKGSPLFFRKKKAAAAHENAQQEPSSPKVTCIGQVRVRRSKNNARSRSHCHCHSRRRSEPAERKNRCWFGRKFLCCPWRKWVGFFCCRSAKVRTGSSRAGSTSNRVEEDESRSCRTHEEEDEEESGERESVNRGVSSSCGEAALVSTPPKNALLLTRCRSAPYRSSSLACRLWVEEFEERESKNRAQKLTGEEREKDAVSVASGTEPGPAGGGRDSASETRLNRSAPGLNRSEIGSGNQQNEEGRPSVPPLIVLMRSRSEPVRRGRERLDPLTSQFWRERRLSDTDKTSQTCKPHVGD